MSYIVRPSYPDQPQLRDAVTSANKYKNDDVLLEPGDYYFLTPFQVTGTSVYEKIDLGGRVRGTVNLLFPSLFTDQCVKFQSDGGSRIHDLNIIGPNTRPDYFEPINDQSLYIAPGIKVDRYLPQAGICIDPLSGTGSTDMTFERITVQKCGVGWLFSPNGSSLNADRIKLFECSALKCDIGVSHSQAQSKANVIRNFTLSACRVGFTGMTHGARQGVPPKIDGLQADWSHHLMEYYSAFGIVLDWCGVYSEAIGGIGNWGAGSPENKTSGSIRNSTFNIGISGWTHQQVGVNNPVVCLFETHAGFVFDSCYIVNNYGTNLPFVSGTKGQLFFNNMNINPTVTLG